MLGKSLKFLSIFFMASVLILSTAPSLMAGGGWEPGSSSTLVGKILSAKLEVIVFEDHFPPSGMWCTTTTGTYHDPNDPCHLDPEDPLWVPCTPCETDCSPRCGHYGTDTRIVTITYHGKTEVFYDSLMATLPNPEKALMGIEPVNIIGAIPAVSCIGQQILVKYGHWPEIVEAVITEKIYCSSDSCPYGVVCDPCPGVDCNNCNSCPSILRADIKIKLME